METNTNRFRDDFKYFKKKCPPPDLSKVLDFSKPTNDTCVKKLTACSSTSLCSSEEIKIASLLIPPSEWNVYELLDKPGLLFISNPFTKAGQRYWICRCLRDYTQRPNKLNIDAHNILEKSQDWWDIVQRGYQNSSSLKKKLRWATMGYHHNWDTKVYSEDSKDPFPADLAVLSKYVSRVVGLQEDFRAEAAIVNFYHFDSTLSGHTDHSEMDMTAPLFSFSFGQTAIFLLGGISQDCSPTPIYIKSGDIVIMSGFSRKCYHGIPKIIPAQEVPWDDEAEIRSQQNVDSCNNKDIDSFCDQPCKRARMDEKVISAADPRIIDHCKFPYDDVVKNVLNDKFWEPFKMYIASARINMNVRQVLAEGVESLHN